MKQSIFLLMLASILWMAACEATEKQRPVLQYDRTNPAGNGSRFPHLYTHDGETLYMSWMTRIEEGMAAIEYARYRDGIWESPRTVHVGNDLYLSWDSRPEMALLTGDQPIVSWVRAREGAIPHRELQIALPAERYWNHIRPHESGHGTHREGLNMSALDTGHVMVWWFEHNGSAELNQPASGGLQTGIVGLDGRVEQTGAVQEDLLSCGPTALHRLEDGLAGVYREWEEDGRHRLVLTRWSQESREWIRQAGLGGERWSDPVCPVGGPAIAGTGDELAVVWYDEVDEEAIIRLATVQRDGTGMEPVRISTGVPGQRVAITEGPDGAFYIVWMEQRGELSDLYLQTIRNGELLAEPVRLGATDAGKASGIPVLAPMNNMLVVAWTQTEPFFRIRTIHVPWPEETPQTP